MLLPISIRVKSDYEFYSVDRRSDEPIQPSAELRQWNTGKGVDIKPTVLFCTASGATASGASYGIGHLTRAVSLIRVGRSLFSASLCITRGDAECLSERINLPSGTKIFRRIQDAGRVDLIVSDMRNTGRREMAALNRIAPVLSIDDCGPGGELSFITMYTLPALNSVHGNLQGTDYLILNEKIRTLQTSDAVKSIGVLVSFGGEDPFNLTGYVTSVLNSIGITPVVVTGPLYRHKTVEGECRVVHNPSDLFELISQSEVLITSFGMTMYEAFYLRTPVVLFNHSRYHFILAEKVQAVNLGYFGGIEKQDFRPRLKEVVDDKDTLRRNAEKCATLVDGKGASRVAAIIMRAASSGRTDCLFKHGRPAVLKRTESYTLFRCRRCGDLFLFSFGEGKDAKYTKSSYFLSEYKRLYGKTYIEDRENISSAGRRRLDIIERYIREKGRLLDIGCAMGFFLETARERGWDVEGVEISPYAGQWAVKNLSLDVKTGNFLDLEYENDSVDVVSLFFVAEHFYNVEKVIERVRLLLRDGGLVAIGLPNRGGISYRLNRRKYLSSHPADHYFDTRPATLIKLLKQYGFRKKNICITGIHPERFYKRMGIGINRFSDGGALASGIYFLLVKLYFVFAQFLRLGDTFEYYGIKKA